MARKSGLGKGLSALIPQQSEEHSQYFDIDIDLIEPNPEQPRHQFDAHSLDELAASIKANGVIQPIIVTRSGSRYRLIAGERRWRASQLAGFHKIPAVVREVDSNQMLTLALLENIQRQELNPIEEAQAYRNLIEQHRYTQETLSKQLGKSRASISNTIRLLKLPETVRDLVEDGLLSFGHAKCLITLQQSKTQQRLATLCVTKQWSVRELERQIQLLSRKTKTKPKPERSVFIRKAEDIFRKAVGSKVVIQGNENKGRVVIPYASADQLQDIYEWLTKQDSMEE